MGCRTSPVGCGPSTATKLACRTFRLCSGDEVAYAFDQVLLVWRGALSRLGTAIVYNKHVLRRGNPCRPRVSQGRGPRRGGESVELASRLRKRPCGQPISSDHLLCVAHFCIRRENDPTPYYAVSCSDVMKRTYKFLLGTLTRQRAPARREAAFSGNDTGEHRQRQVYHDRPF
jgi:hypothetical protein